ncbi:hypothetical protein [Amycolatopsis cihanbeyliensis]|uniref:Uncharacterized protein n=1 Tax=Amycolatopsis cihanbeyliensis TaxID=1128664 RepID=A0A542DJI4_AMYCI|nr:hypothetical protein [Amycolatopsis cihanbeyliensis]TQJ03261.1 hypothetical protein FB471_3016 [Amycolatopsis cihanbeyliensis]
MTRLLITDVDPGSADPSAKNVPAGPGLPTTYSASDMERTPMVDTLTPAVDVRWSAELADVVGRRPKQSAFLESRTFEAARLTWLFDLAAALHAAGLDEDAAHVQNAALDLIHAAVTEAGGEGR